MTATMEVAFSSLADLFRGEWDAEPVYKPGLIAKICDALADPPPHCYAVADVLYPELKDVGPRTLEKYAQEIGTEAMSAIQMGYMLWRDQRAARVRAVPD